MIAFREDARPTDVDAVRDIVSSTGFFHDFEVGVAVELIEDRVRRGPASDYRFVFAEHDGAVVGYACFGLIACTVGSFDLYWIAVRRELRGAGVGGAIMKQVERLIAELGGKRVYLETSSRDIYAPTRAFYLRCGYALEAVIKDFYDEGDDKLVYAKRLVVSLTP